MLPPRPLPVDCGGTIVRGAAPRPQRIFVTTPRNEPLDEEEFRAYQTKFGMREDDKREACQSSIQPPPPPPTFHDEDDSSLSQPIEDQVQDLTIRFDTFWDKTQEHQVSMSQEM